MMSHEIFQRAEELMRQAQEARQREIAQVVQEIRDAMSTHGLTIADIDPKAVPKAPRKFQVAVKYRHPAGHTWTGRGRAPKWVQAVKDAGDTIETYRVAA